MLRISCQHAVVCEDVGRLNTKVDKVLNGWLRCSSMSVSVVAAMVEGAATDCRALQLLPPESTTMIVDATVALCYRNYADHPADEGFNFAVGNER
jgi:hypothetical protein